MVTVSEQSWEHTREWLWRHMGWTPCPMLCRMPRLHRQLCCWLCLQDDCPSVPPSLSQPRAVLGTTGSPAQQLEGELASAAESWRVLGRDRRGCGVLAVPQSVQRSSHALRQWEINTRRKEASIPVTLELTDR